MTVTSPEQLRAPKRQRLISVTTLLDAILPKPGLLPWSEAQTVKGVATLARAGEPVDRMSDDEILHALRENQIGADGVRTGAAKRGVNVHSLLERWENDGAWADPVGVLDVEDYPFAHALNDWLREWRPEPIEREQLVADPAAGFAGRFDLFCRIGGQLTLVDATTADRAAIWPAKHYQTRMYERGRRVCGDEPADRLLIVVFSRDGTWREMDVLATDRAVADALAHHRGLKPVDQACNQANRAEKTARTEPAEPNPPKPKVERVEGDESTYPGAMSRTLRRELPDGGLLEFEEAPAGYTTKDGTRRSQAWRAYWYQPPVQTTLPVAKAA